MWKHVATSHARRAWLNQSACGLHKERWPCTIAEVGAGYIYAKQACTWGSVPAGAGCHDLAVLLCLYAAWKHATTRHALTHHVYANVARSNPCLEGRCMRGSFLRCCTTSSCLVATALRSDSAHDSRGRCTKFFIFTPSYHNKSSNAQMHIQGRREPCHSCAICDS